MVVFAGSCSSSSIMLIHKLKNDSFLSSGTSSYGFTSHASRDQERGPVGESTDAGPQL